MTPQLLEAPDDEQETEPTADSETADAPTEEVADATPAETVRVETDRGTASVSLPPTATAEETAAIAAALSVHLDEEESDEETRPVDRWKLSSRLGRNGHGRKRARTPRAYSRGSEWKFANRAW